MFQGEVVSVEIYPGDNEGHRLTKEHLQENGYFKQPNGNAAIGYSKATVKVYKVYKGNVTSETIDVITHSSSLQLYVRHHNGKDTLLYNYWQPSHGGEVIYLPRQKGSYYIFFLGLDESKQVYNTSISGNISLGYDNSTSEINFAGAGGIFADYFNSFDSEELLNGFLSSFPSLNLKNPRSHISQPSKTISPVKKMLVQKTLLKEVI